MGIILPATDGKTSIFSHVYFTLILFICSHFCSAIILFLKQESGLQARAIFQENQEKSETNILFRNRGFVLFEHRFKFILF